MITRSTSSAAVAAVFTSSEQELLDHIVPDRQKGGATRKSRPSYIIKVARFGSYLSCAEDPPPGNTVIWRRLYRLTDIELRFTWANLVGN